MGIYSRINEFSLGDVTDIIECTTEPGIDAAYKIVAESEENYNRIMQAIGIHELAVFESTGSEMVYEATDIKSLMKTVRDFFINLLKKIRGLFEKFFAMLDGFIKSDKEFVKKYGPKLIPMDTKGFTYKGFNFDNVDRFKLPSDADMTSLYKDETDQTGKEEIINKMRGLVHGSGKSIEQSEFAKELFMLFRDGKEEKIELKNINVRDQLAIIEGRSNLKKKAQDNYNELQDTIKKSITQLETQSKEATDAAVKDGGDEKITEARKLSTQISYAKDKLSVLQVINGAHLTAIKDKSRQAKSICVRLVGYTPKNVEQTSKNEGYSFTDSMNESFLSSVVLK